MTPEQAAALRKPFAASATGKLPKGVKKDDPDKGRCEQGSRYSADGFFCGGWHSKSIHLDFCGHAAVTDRLLAADPNWSWEPFAVDEVGLPAYQNGALWIRLTVCGVTRIGVGDGPDPKQRIGDAIRNAAMRFGVALDLWSRQELEGVDPNGGDSAATPRPAPAEHSAPPPEPAPTPAPDSAPPVSPATGAEQPAAPGEPDSSSSSPEAVVENLRSRVIEAMDLPKKDALPKLARLSAEAVKAKVQGEMTTSPKGAAMTVGALLDAALGFVSQAEAGAA
jgi:hypothetical protein